MTLEEKELEIIKHYGVMPQLKYFQSEVFELNESIIKYEEVQDRALAELDCYPEWEEEYIKHIQEEVADVQLMLNQFKRYYDLDETNIKIMMDYKATRQLERIEEENG